MPFIPYGSDAPVYHRPYGTFGILAVNVLVFFCTMHLPEETARKLILVYGDGLKPTQWVTSSFMHGSILHLAGNMLFLYIFGLIVEGKVGLLRFVLIYMGISISQNAVEQTIALGMDQGSLGSSSVIWGLLAISCVWAPKNDIFFVYYFLPFVGRASFSVRAVAFFYIGVDVFFGYLGYTMSGGLNSSLLHVLGAVIGFIVGLVMLQKNWVDCEGWDLLTIMRGGRPGRLYRPSVPDPVEGRGEATDVKEQRQIALGLIKDYLQEKNPVLAYTVFQDTVSETGPWPLSESYLKHLIKGLYRHGKLKEAEALSQQYIRRFPERSVAMRMLLAMVLLDQERPASCLETLSLVPPEALPGEFRRKREALVQRAKRMRDDGMLEL